MAGRVNLGEADCSATALEGLEIQRLMQRQGCKVENPCFQRVFAALNCMPDICLPFDSAAAIFALPRQPTP